MAAQLEQLVNHEAKRAKFGQRAMNKLIANPHVGNPKTKGRNAKTQRPK